MLLPLINPPFIVSQEMVNGLENKSFRWQFVKSLEPPRVVHVRTTEMLSKDNLYAQVTVRLHTQQVNITVPCF